MKKLYTISPKNKPLEITFKKWILVLTLFLSQYSNLDAQGGIRAKSKGEDPSFSFNIFPNPNAGKFSVVIKEIDESYDINVYNLIGEMVYHWESNGASPSNLEINLTKQPKGVYLVELDTERANTIKKVLIDN